MAKGSEFFEKSKHTIVWTVLYVLFMWVVLRYLFNFNMFSLAHWTKMLHVQLHGFAGFVFGVLVLAAVPLYVATVVLTARNKGIPIKIPLPNCLTEKPKQVQEPEPEPIVSEQEILPELPHGVPAEMRETFMRAKKNYGSHQRSVFNRPMHFDDSPVAATVVRTPENIAQPVDVPKSMPSTPVPTIADAITEIPSDTVPTLPIPTDFDVSVDDSSNSDIPVFSDIKFDDDIEDEKLDEKDTVAENVKENSVQKMINDAGYETKLQGNLILVNNCAVAVHDEDDFWVADEIDWFAAGRQKPSPIVELKKAKEEQGLNPILYIVNNNIMDYDKLVETWRKDGITIATNNDELIESIKADKKVSD